jgi:hypothetical protein
MLWSIMALTIAMWRGTGSSPLTYLRMVRGIAQQLHLKDGARKTTETIDIIAIVATASNLALGNAANASNSQNSA